MGCSKSTKASYFLNIKHMLLWWIKYYIKNIINLFNGGWSPIEHLKRKEDIRSWPIHEQVDGFSRTYSTYFPYMQNIKHEWYLYKKNIHVVKRVYFIHYFVGLFIRIDANRSCSILAAFSLIFGFELDVCCI